MTGDEPNILITLEHYALSDDGRPWSLCLLRNGESSPSHLASLKRFLTETEARQEASHLFPHAAIVSNTVFDDEVARRRAIAYDRFRVTKCPDWRPE